MKTFDEIYNICKLNEALIRLFELVFNKELDEQMILAEKIWQMYVDNADEDWHTLHAKKLELTKGKQYKLGCPLCNSYCKTKLDCSDQCPLKYNGKTCYMEGSLCRQWKYAKTKEEAKKIAQFIVGRIRIARAMRQQDANTSLNSAMLKNTKNNPFHFLNQ